MRGVINRTIITGGTFWLVVARDMAKQRPFLRDPSPGLDSKLCKNPWDSDFWIMFRLDGDKSMFLLITIRILHSYSARIIVSSMYTFLRYRFIKILSGSRANIKSLCRPPTFWVYLQTFLLICVAIWWMDRALWCHADDPRSGTTARSEETEAARILRCKPRELFQWTIGACQGNYEYLAWSGTRITTPEKTYGIIWVNDEKIENHGDTCENERKATISRSLNLLIQIWRLCAV
jgi:hypothetical protein